MAKSKYLNTEDVKIYYEIKQGKPLLVFLHGSGDNNTVFNHQKKYFKQKGMGYIAIDQRGMGKSSPLISSQAYTLDAYVSDLEKILKQENIKEMVLIGYSMGGMIAQYYAAKNPEKVKALILISTSSDFSESFKRNFISSMFLKMTPKLRKGAIVYNKIVNLFRKENNYYPDYSNEKYKKKIEMAIGAETITNLNSKHLEAMEILGEQVLKWNTETILSKIKAPTLLINGELDALVKNKAAQKLYKNIQNCKKLITIPKARHGLVFQKPEQVTQVIEEFLIEWV